MSDGLTASPTQHLRDPALPADRPGWVVPAWQALVILLVFGAAGLLCGWLWFRMWDVPEGVVAGHQWFTTEAGLRADFAGVAWYVSIASLAGFVLGALCAWLLARSELVTLAAVLVGSVLAAYLMLRLGQHLSPPDPHELAKTADDGKRLQGALRVAAWPPRAAFPFGALVGLTVVFTASVRRLPAEPEGPKSPAGDGTRG